MTGAPKREPFDLSDAESILGELKAIVLLTRMCVENSGEVDDDRKDAVLFLSCLAHERVAQLDEMVQRALTG